MDGGEVSLGPGIQAFRLVPGRWEIAGPPIHVTAGPSREEHVSATNSGSLAFASLTNITNIWGLPIDHKTATPAGDLRRLTRNADFTVPREIEPSKQPWYRLGHRWHYRGKLPRVQLRLVSTLSQCGKTDRRL